MFYYLWDDNIHISSIAVQNYKNIIWKTESSKREREKKETKGHGMDIQTDKLNYGVDIPGPLKEVRG